MATTLLALLDDITSVLDDVATMTKVATQKTAGVLGDDLALNAQQVSGVHADRELPVVWAVAKGSLRNKAVLVPAALAISAFAPWLITPLLMLGGAYLCYEGFEKIAHRLFHGKRHEARGPTAPVVGEPMAPRELKAMEKTKIAGAVRTDFILSAEIITISLGAVATATFGVKVGVLVAVALLMTVGVYGLVAGIVKLDDLGLHLLAKRGASFLDRIRRLFGAAVVRASPWLMKTLSIVGTAAMFLVGGGILSHGIPGVESWLHRRIDPIDDAPVFGEIVAMLGPMLFNAVIGIVAGAVVLAVVGAGQRVVSALRPSGTP
jgi:predicted DNA repair protein MutK